MATATGVTNSYGLAADIYNSLFGDVAFGREATGQQLSDIANLLAELRYYDLVKGNDSKLSAKGSDGGFSASGSITGSNLLQAGSAPTWTGANLSISETNSVREGSYSGSYSVKNVFSSKLSGYKPGQATNFDISSWNYSLSTSEKEASGGNSYAETTSLSTAFQGLYQSRLNGTDTIKLNKLTSKYSFSLKETYQGSSGSLTESGSITVTSKNFTYQSSNGGETISGGTGVVDSIKFNFKSTDMGLNESYTGTAISGAALATNDMDAFIAALFAGNDTITGTTGNDVLYGFAGNDVITGGKGVDIMIGGTGNDTFAFKTGDFPLDLQNHDVIMDFGNGQDVLKIGKKAVDGKNYQELQQTFMSAAAAKQAADAAFSATKVKANYVFAYVNDGDSVDSGFLFTDLNGDGLADGLIELVGVSAADFSAASIA